MALKWADNCVEESTTTTTGAYQLGGVPSSGIGPGAQGFVAGVGDTHTCYYYAYEVSGTAWERGLGTVTDATPDTLTRTAIYASSNGGAAVDWTGKTVRVRVVEPARSMYTDHAGMVENATLACSRSGNAETIALKTLAGTDPSASDPVRVAFAKTDGTFEVLEVTAALSLVISSGSTLGAVSAEAFRAWLVLFNDAGTLRLGAVKCALTDGVRGLNDNMQESSTAEGGAGGADSAGVIYTGTAVTSKFCRVLGYAEYTLTTAGTWNAAPSLIKLWSPGDRLPGDTVQVRRVSDGAFDAGGTTLVPADNTIPQSNEGMQFASTQSITPTSAINYLEISASINVENSVDNNIVIALFRDAAADALAACIDRNGAANARTVLSIAHTMKAGAVASTTFKIRCGGTTAGTTRFNSIAGAAGFGSVFASFIKVTEIMV